MNLKVDRLLLRNAIESSNGRQAWVRESELLAGCCPPLVRCGLRVGYITGVAYSVMTAVTKLIVKLHRNLPSPSSFFLGSVFFLKSLFCKKHAGPASLRFQDE